VVSPPVPDVAGFAQGLAQRVQAHPSMVLDEAQCRAAQQSALLPDVPL
jgi:hypothetical protein